LCGCYAPEPREDLPCSETRHCPDGQRCDTTYALCTSVPLCKPSPISDAFDGAPACESWARQYGNGAFDVRNSRLVLTPAPGQTCGCASTSDTIPFDDAGVFIEVAMTTSGNGAMSMRTVAGNYSPMIDQADGKLKFRLFSSGGTVAERPYDAPRMRWWRLRPTPDRHGTIAEYSAEGIEWSVLGTSDMPAPDTIGVVLDAASDTGGSAEIEGLGICPEGSRPPP
jgi:hypothetical protein